MPKNHPARLLREFERYGQRGQAREEQARSDRQRLRVAVQEAQEGMSVTAIAESLGWSRQSVYELLREAPDA